MWLSSAALVYVVFISIAFVVFVIVIVVIVSSAWPPWRKLMGTASGCLNEVFHHVERHASCFPVFAGVFVFIHGVFVCDAFSCPGQARVWQVNKWPCHSVTHLISFDHHFASYFCTWSEGCLGVEEPIQTYSFQGGTRNWYQSINQCLFLCNKP